MRSAETCQSAFRGINGIPCLVVADAVAKVSPAPEALASVEPFCVDCLTFSEWLQWVYIPKMHAYMNEHGRLPAASGLVPIAEEAWKGSVEDTRRLQEVVVLLDALVVGDTDALASFWDRVVKH